LWASDDASLKFQVVTTINLSLFWENIKTINNNKINHDTIGQVAIDKNNNVACGTSTNGATHKIPGRVGDSPIPGSGAYCENGVGGCVGTGAGDILLRFSPAVKVVLYMKQGMKPKDACKQAIEEIQLFYPNVPAALLALNDKGEFGCWASGPFQQFPFLVQEGINGTIRTYTMFTQP